MTCTFFGHKDTPKEIEPILLSTLIDLIVNKEVKNFYIGNNGNFDHLVRKVLKKLTDIYPKIRYSVVLAYYPLKPEKNKDFSDTIFPAELTNVPPKHAISKRNEWMIKQCDYVVTYIKYSTGGAVRFAEYALKKDKFVINLADESF